MRLIREVEQRLSLLFGDGEIPGFIHLSIGQEAVRGRRRRALRTDDTLASNHRGHGHAIAKGLDLSRFFLEIMGRSEGYCGGRGGSMHVAHMSVGMLARTASSALDFLSRSAARWRINCAKTGATSPACFLAMAPWPKACCMRASTWPPCGGCRFYLFARITAGVVIPPAARQLATEPSKLAGTFEIPAERVDGNDIVAVRAAALQAIETVLAAGGGPRLCRMQDHAGARPF